MFHHVAHTVPDRRLFTTWGEGLEVWRALLRAVPRPIALCLMPDHLHLLARHDVRQRLAACLSGVARRRNWSEGRTGPLFLRLPAPTRVIGEDKQRRNLRYVHLNPCRARLVDDPLAWPLSTHRDACGLAAPGVVPTRHPERFHRYVSSDPRVAVAGTPLPVEPDRVDDPMAVLVAVSAVTRVPLHHLGAHPGARALVLGAMDELCPLSQRQLAPLLRVARRTLRGTSSPDPAAREAVRRVVLDPRFEPIDRDRVVVPRPQAWG